MWFSRLRETLLLSTAAVRATRRLQHSDSARRLTVREQCGGIRTITLNNPRKRNALCLNMLSSLREDLLTDMDSEELRVIIIAANGPVFSSGHDLKELTPAQGREYHHQVFTVCAEVMTLIQDHPVPVMAKVNGIATAAGCQLVASCDIVVATETSTFATPGVNVGLFCSTPAVAIGRTVPRKVAMEMLITGAPISAHDAMRHGLVSKVVPAEKLEEETLLIAQRVCEASRPVIALGKATFNRQMAQGRDAAYCIASAAMVDNLALKDGQEGIKAFLEKRKPVWANSREKAYKCAPRSAQSTGARAPHGTRRGAGPSDRRSGAAHLSAVAAGRVRHRGGVQRTSLPRFVCFNNISVPAGAMEEGLI
ncbi:enoyl-CoA hydratase domain-containing protein 3, mitochondrial [Arapaima gigas]